MDLNAQRRKSELLQWLNQAAEPSYRSFAGSLLPPGGPPLLGVRLPILRRAAKVIAAGDWRDFFLWVGRDSFEQIMLHGMVLGALPLSQISVPELLTEIQNFLPEISNWSLCDSFCSSLKVARQIREQMYPFLLSLLQDTHGYSARFAIVMLNDYFLTEAYIDDVVGRLCALGPSAPYVQTAAAWTLCSCWPLRREILKQLLKTDRIPAPIAAVTRQKLLDSRKVSTEDKNWLREEIPAPKSRMCTDF